MDRLKKAQLVWTSEVATSRIRRRAIIGWKDETLNFLVYFGTSQKHFSKESYDHFIERCSGGQI